MGEAIGWRRGGLEMLGHRDLAFVAGLGHVYAVDGEERLDGYV